MSRGVKMAAGVAGAAMLLSLTPAVARPGAVRMPPAVKAKVKGTLPGFTPAGADPKLVALMAREGVSTAGLRFTPASVVRVSKSVTVAVRASTLAPRASDAERVAVLNTNPVAIAPIAYNLGVSVGWKRLALSSDFEKVERPGLGGRESVDVGLSYNTHRWSTRVAAGVDRPTTTSIRALEEGAGYNFDLGTRYSVSSRLDVSAGLKYRTVDRDRLAPLNDNRQDSQAVYLGTSFRF